MVFNGTEDVLDGNLDVNNIIAVPRSPRNIESIKIIARILLKYDLAIVTQGGDRAFTYGVLSARQCIGMVPDRKLKNLWKRLLCKHYTILDDISTHTITQNLLLSDKLHLTPITIVSPPMAYLPKNIEENIKRPYCVIHLMPRMPYKEWPLERWHTLIGKLVEKGYHVYLTGKGDNDLDAAAKVSDIYHGKVFNMVNRLSFGGVTKLLHGASFYVGPDTSITHIAAATGVRTVALYGPSNPVKWGPWPASYNGKLMRSPYKLYGYPWQKAGNVILLQGVQPCVPCREEGCERNIMSKSKCLYSITEHTVLLAIETLLDDRPEWYRDIANDN